MRGALGEQLMRKGFKPNSLNMPSHLLSPVSHLYLTMWFVQASPPPGQGTLFTQSTNEGVFMIRTTTELSWWVIHSPSFMPVFHQQLFEELESHHLKAQGRQSFRYSSRGGLVPKAPQHETVWPIMRLYEIVLGHLMMANSLPNFIQSIIKVKQGCPLAEPLQDLYWWARVFPTWA